MSLFLSKEEKELLKEAKAEEKKEQSEKLELSKQQEFEEKLLKYGLPKNYKNQNEKGEYEYLVKTIEDEGIYYIDYSLFQDLGWSVKNIHTKQLGINAASINGFGANNILNVTVVTFERKRK